MTSGSGRESVESSLWPMYGSHTALHSPTDPICPGQCMVPICPCLTPPSGPAWKAHLSPVGRALSHRMDPTRDAQCIDPIHWSHLHLSGRACGAHAGGRTGPMRWDQMYGTHMLNVWMPYVPANVRIPYTFTSGRAGLPQVATRVMYGSYVSRSIWGVPTAQCMDPIHPVQMYGPHTLLAVKSERQGARGSRPSARGSRSTYGSHTSRSNVWIPWGGGRG